MTHPLLPHGGFSVLRVLSAMTLLATGAHLAHAQTFPQIFDNGPFVNLPGAGFNGADVSQVESGTSISLGFNASATQLPRVADDFVINASSSVRQRLARLRFYGVQSQTSNFTTNVQFGALYIALYDTNPSSGAAPIAGDFTTNRLLSSTWTGAYRVGSGSTASVLQSQTRPITRLEADMSWTPRLANGTYWMVLSAVGDTALATSPNPQTILVTPRLTGSNGLQQFNGSWVATADYPFQLFGYCPGDFNASGTVSVQDIFDFLSAWFASSASADVNLAGGVSVQDIFDFLSAWFQTC